MLKINDYLNVLSANQVARLISHFKTPEKQDFISQITCEEKKVIIQDLVPEAVQQVSLIDREDIHQISKGLADLDGTTFDDMSEELKKLYG